MLAATAGVVAVRAAARRLGGRQQSRPRSRPRRRRASSTDAQKAARKTAVDAVLAKRSTAVLKGDLKGFLAVVDPKQPQLVARQRMLFTNLRKFRFTILTVLRRRRASSRRR